MQERMCVSLADFQPTMRGAMWAHFLYTSERIIIKKKMWGDTLDRKSESKQKGGL